MVFNAPCKVNLYLGVLYRRDDGYHEIETLFEKISICDRLIVELSREKTSVTCDNPDVPTGDGSLLMRTIELFNKKSGKKADFNVHLEKKIPISAGLGGGSSDAAVLLKALNQVSGSPLGMEDMLGICRELGADVPFFLYDMPFARGMGRGDVISEVKIPVKMWHVIVTAPFGVSTKEVYGKLGDLAAKNKIGSGNKTDIFSDLKSVKDIARDMHNDLQKITLEDFPVLQKVFSRMKAAGAEGVLLSGSGPSVFGIFDTEKSALKAKEALERAFCSSDGWKVQVACTYC